VGSAASQAVSFKVKFALTDCESQRKPSDVEMILREMKPADVRHCINVRTMVRENHYSLEALRQAGITEESVCEMIATTHKGWVCETNQRVIGFSMGNRSNGEFWVVAVLPEYEGKGIGRKLMELAVQWLRASGCAEIWLWTSPDVGTRAYGLYQKSGWQDCGIQNGQRIMKLRKEKEA
jgi:GNAT superfamily N-acetyltransferase